ncbi:MAG TPA: hypothetical protein DD671_06100, partial [Balneolaceae bacterium]|nr:hypothetical protein [Balneolaceae bacterium]
MWFVYLFAIISLFPLTTFAQNETGTLTGFVFDAETEDPLPYANIIVTGTSKGTYTNNMGAYSIKLPEGEVNIRYRFLSFQDTVITVQITAGEETEQTVYLK